MEGVDSLPAEVLIGVVNSGVLAVDCGIRSCTIILTH